MTTLNTEQTEIEALLADFNRVREQLVDAASAVPPRLRNTPFVGIWDLFDVVAHTVGWDYTNIEALPDFAAGRLPAFFAQYDADWASVNAGLVARYRLQDWDDQLASVVDSQKAFDAAMRGLSAGDLDNIAIWGKRRISLRGMMRAVSRDESQHVAQIQTLIAERAP
jgi:DinB superfamily